MIKETEKKTVWSKAREVLNMDPTHYRIDECGALIKYEDYNNRNSDFGWEEDHIRPSSKGGEDDITNLRPMQWENNVVRGNGPLQCKIQFNGKHNTIIPNWDILYE